ncbi:hypothetical protein EJ04DRAFT_336669 [Polyplosphaeria fusca]|uniref:non-specific serine/threonine protein kinase n=1 Tax=Polyplosphaeria fusca TaxID=682080 RepID=A0A9P4QW75_9PLEO|nr:hypothetical protein EJ04DRAFT_336669 [Polyplosphaeria fusca]
MVSHPPPPKAAHSHSNSRSSQHSSNTPAHAKKPSSSSAREDKRPSREGSVQRAAQDVVGLKDFQLGDCLGKGASGSVYRALNWGTGETVAIKQVRLENMQSTELKTIMLEIDLLKNLNHANIVKYHGFVKSSESLYIILEYCENGSLHSICKNFGKFPENLVALYMSQVLHGLVYLHEQGVIHRDIKGANILTTKEGLVKLADFGVATKSADLAQLSVVGTPYWMAPEVIELSGASTASDIWSVGCTVIELIEGKPPYHKLQPMQALFRIVNDEHPPIPGSVSPLVRDFLMECFQKNPTLRISAKRLLKHAWISSARRTQKTSDPTKPTEYTEAVKSVQEWNEALRSPHSLRRSSRLAAGTKKDGPQVPQAHVPASRKATANVNIPKPRPSAESFRSPDVDADDNWDDDFAESISPSALHLPHLKPQDNFGGRFSHDKLKAMASFDASAEDQSILDGEATVKSPLDLKHLQGYPEPFEEPETVRSSSMRAKAPPSRQASATMAPEEKHERQPKTAFLRGVPQATQLAKTKVAALARPSTLFREDSVEDYSDLTAEDESAFQKHVKRYQVQQPHTRAPPPVSVVKQTSSSPRDNFSPRLFHPSDLKSTPNSTRDAKLNGTARKRSVSSTSARKMERSKSEIEMEKYAEDDDVDFSDVNFGDKELGLSRKPESDSGSDYSGMVMITSKMSSSFMITDDDDMDPFANFEEGLENINLENNVARDRDDRLVKQTESLVGALKSSQSDEFLLDIADQLLQVLYESPDKKLIVLRSHGMLPMLEILGTGPPPHDIVLRLLKIINMIILEDSESQESLSFLGGIPIITGFASKKYPSEIRAEAAAFVRQMYQTSTLTLQMFIGCGGINVLVEFLEEDIDTEYDLVMIGVNGVWSVFELQGPTPKNDFCRIFSRSSVLYPLSLVLNRVVDETGDLARDIEGRIVNIFLIFSQAESHVKDLVADRMILKRVLKDLRKMSPNHQVTMLKFIKNLSMLSSTHEALQNSNAIDILIDLLKASRHKTLYREISNQILNTMYNLCRHNRSRQEEAALSDIVPVLKDVVQNGGHLKEFALPILFELAHSGKVARKMLWDAKGLQFYIEVLGDRNWQVFALDSIFIWLQEETARVEQYLLRSNFSAAIIISYTSPQSTFESLLEPLQKIVRLSPPIARSLAVQDIFTRTVQKLGHKDAVTRLNLLRILRTICDATDDECTLIKKYGVYDTISYLSDSDSAILVRQMADELIRACDDAGKRSVSRGSALRRPLSSTSHRAGSGSSNGSMTVGMTPPTPTSLGKSFQLPPTPISRERVGRSQSTAGIWDLVEEPEKQIIAPAPLTRAATAVSAMSSSSTPTSSTRRPPSRDTAASLARMQANQDSLNSTANKAQSRLPKARQGRLSEIVNRRRRGEGDVSLGDENAPQQPLPRLQIARRRRDTSGGEMGLGSGGASRRGE